MVRQSCRWLPLTLALLLAGGCLYPVREKVDSVVCDLDAQPRDVQTSQVEGPTAATSTPTDAKGEKPAKVGKTAAPDKDQTMTLVAAEQGERRDQPSILDRLELGRDFPGGNAPKIELPPFKPENKAERERIINKLYPPLDPLGTDPAPLAGPDGHPLTLSDLQRIALAKHPSIRQAAARVEAARGAAIQAGMPSNPTFSAEGDTFGTAGAPGYEGFFLEQRIPLLNRLQLQRAAAAMDLKNAEVALRRAETDLAHQVRGNYFAVLVALESMRINKALVDFTTSVYDIQLDQLKVGGLAAPYEPMLLRVAALQARLALYQSRNQYQSSWKLLAASLGQPTLAPTEVAGRLDIPVPVYDHARVLEWALIHHTDVRTAQNSLLQSNYQLRLAQLVPISDADLRIGAQKDYTGPPHLVVGTVALAFTIPIWDRNQGGIIQAQGNVVAASEQEHLARTNLTTTLATAYNTYVNNRLAIEMYRKEILPRQVQGYRALYERFQGEGLRIAPAAGSTTPAFGDLLSAQSTLVTNVQAYTVALGALWQSVTDVADVLQTDDLYQIGGEAVPTEALEAVPDLRQLPALPCCHPCAPPDAAFGSDNGVWDRVAPGWDEQPAAPLKAELIKAPHVEPPPPPAPKPLPEAVVPPLAPQPLPQAGVSVGGERQTTVVPPLAPKPLPQAIVPPPAPKALPPAVVPTLVPMPAAPVERIEPKVWPSAYAEPSATIHDDAKPKPPPAETPKPQPPVLPITPEGPDYLPPFSTAPAAHPVESKIWPAVYTEPLAVAKDDVKKVRKSPPNTAPSTKLPPAPEVPKPLPGEQPSARVRPASGVAPTTLKPPPPGGVAPLPALRPDSPKAVPQAAIDQTLLEAPPTVSIMPWSDKKD